MGCPLCTRWGMIFFISGIVLIIVGLYIKYIYYLGLLLIVSAYVVPFILSRYTDRGSRCASSCGVEKIGNDEENNLSRDQGEC